MFVKKFPPRTFNAPVEGVPLEFCSGGGSQKREWRPLPECQKKYDDMSIRLHTNRQTDGRRDGQRELL